MSDAVRKREESFRKGEVRRVINSVLGAKKTSMRLASTTSKEGEIKTDPVTKHFADTFSGRSADKWYEAAETPELVKQFFVDSVQGRELKEEVRAGRLSQRQRYAWAQVEDRTHRRLPDWLRAKWVLSEVHPTGRGESLGRLVQRGSR